MTIGSAARYLACVVLCAGLALGAQAGTPEEDATLGLIAGHHDDLEGPGTGRLQRALDEGAIARRDYDLPRERILDRPH
jgi:hypothetical protein